MYTSYSHSCKFSESNDIPCALCKKDKMSWFCLFCTEHMKCHLIPSICMNVRYLYTYDSNFFKNISSCFTIFWIIRKQREQVSSGTVRPHSTNTHYVLLVYSMLYTSWRCNALHIWNLLHTTSMLVPVRDAWTQLSASCSFFCSWCNGSCLC